ncbi:MAG: T9SS type A sorting domain-containing protein [Bacteroidetes bacterium]|nr:T9SS type A sorting domain-containing protein [Bacteroidota bacterium]
MKKILLGLALLITGSATVKAQGVEGFIVEKFYVTNAADNAGFPATGTVLPTGSVVWRFYVDMAAGWELQSVYGDPNHTLNISTTTAFFNNVDRGEAFSHSIAGNQMINNTNYIDSYLSLGGTSSNRVGILKTEDDAVNNIAFAGGYLQNNNATAGQPLTARDGSSSANITPVSITPAGLVLDIFGPSQSPVAGTTFSTSSGAWATTASCVGPTATNRVLIAQITSDGVLTYAFNVQVRNITTFAVENYVPSSPVAAEIALPALAGTLNLSNALPSVAITAPTTGSTYLTGAAVTIDATASDVAPGTVANVEFLVDGVVVGNDITSPYSFTWTSTVGAHILTARATDDLGGQATSSPVNIVVGNVIPPTVSITAPVSGASFTEGDLVNITANATDLAPGTVTNVEFFVNGVSIGSDATSPYAFVWNSVQGTATLTAVATDNDNASATSAPVSVTVFDSSSAYVITTSTNPCSANTFCLPVVATTAVNDVIGYDLVMAFDNTKVIPTGVVTVADDLINSGFTSTANSIDNTNGLMYISVFFNASAPINAEFNGTGELLCVEFARTGGFASVDTATFSVTSLQESYFNGVLPKVVNPGDFITFQESDFSSNLKFWFDGSPIRYNAAVPTDYLITNIYGDNSTCTALSVTAVQPDLAGNFSYDIANGTSINIQKNIPNTTSVQPVVNGFDAFLTRRVLINDATYIPSVYEMIAMDVNIDGVVSAGDLSQINQRAVLIIGEFRQAWNYDASGNPIPGTGPSKDWLFVDGTTLNTDPGFLISSLFPFPDASGYSKSNVPVLDFCIGVPVFSSPSCTVFGIESYTGILMGDVNGNYATVVPNGAFRNAASDKVIFDLTNAVVADGFIDIPVTAMSAETIHALDFAMKFNDSKLTFDKVVNNNNYMETLSNLNSSDKAVRFTSYSLQNFDLTKSLVSVRFATTSNQVVESDLNSLEAYLNGEAVNVQVIGARTALGNESFVNVYPNPATNVMNVVLSENASVELMDASGKVVFGQTNLNAYQKYEINASNLANGVYTLKVYSDSNVSFKKVVVNK